MTRGSADAAPRWVRGTKGYESRQRHIDNWIKDTVYDYILLMDHDMVFPADALVSLLAHGKPYVSGLYMRRQFLPIAPVWFKPWAGAWPLEPWSSDPERGKLHKIGASGWGCLLMHRDVITETSKILKGEQIILEDDLDVWPYDLDAVMGAIKGIRELVGAAGLSAGNLRKTITAHVATLEQEIRPLRVIKNIVGSDIRFPFFALQAGYQLWGDPDVRPGHVLEYPLSPDDFTGQSEEYRKELKQKIRKDFTPERDEIKAKREALK
jgi:hypothetical protein